jgi:glycosyltransferase involved in cell wall biosynthesis
MNVSIALATYNGANFLKEQLKSIKNQSKQPDELVVCDDNSSDQTVSLIQEFAEEVSFPVILLRNEKNQGFVGTFNRALEATTGEWIFLCDQDDFWFPSKIEFTLNQAHKNPDIRLFTNNAELADASLKPSGFTTFGQMSSIGLNPKTLVLGCCMAVKRELLSLCLPISSQFSAHDIWIDDFGKMLETKAVIPEVLQYYRRHGKNETTHIVFSQTKINRFSYAIDYYQKLFFTKKVDSLATRILHTSLKIEALKMAIFKARGIDQQRLNEAKPNLESALRILEQRAKILNNGLFKRLALASALWKDGGYNSTSGIKSFLRDIIGNR